MHKLKKFAPIAISLALLFIIARLAPWPKVIAALSHLSIWTILILVGLSLVYYAAKALRFWYMLRVLKIGERADVVSLIYMAAQPVSLLPAGELYRAKAMETYRGVPMSKSVPTFTSQGIFEGLGIGTVALVSTLALGYKRVPALILFVLVVLGVWGIRRGYLAHFTQLNTIPFIEVNRTKLRQFSDHNQALLRGKPLKVLLAMSVAIELVGVGIAYYSVTGLGGHINVFHAALFYTLPLVVSFLSFLPGGFGASEQSAIGLLLLIGLGSGLAVAATLVMRLAIVGTGVVYGAISWAWVKLRPGDVGARKAAAPSS